MCALFFSIFFFFGSLSGGRCAIDDDSDVFFDAHTLKSRVITREKALSSLLVFASSGAIEKCIHVLIFSRWSIYLRSAFSLSRFLFVLCASENSLK